MNKKKTLCFLQIKRAFCSIPVIFFGTTVFMALVALIAAGGVLLLSSNEESAPMKVAMVVEDDNKYTRMAISYLLEDESVKNTCSFQEMSQKEAESALIDGSVFAVVVIPKDFLAGVLNGTNLPARIILPKAGMNSQSRYFRELIESGASDLATAQAAIYALGDLCMATGIDAITESEDYLNRNLLLFALRRNTYYGKMELSDTGDLTTVQFYAATGIVLLLFFSGITCCDILKREQGAFVNVLKRYEISSGLLAVSKILGVMAVYVPFFLTAYLILSAFHVIAFSVPALFSVIVVVFAVFSMNLFVFWMTDGRMAGTMVLFLGTMVMMFVSGSFIPEVFLSEGMNAIGRVMPVKYITGLCGQILTGEVLLRNVVICMLTGIVFVAASVLCQKLREYFGKD